MFISKDNIIEYEIPDLIIRRVLSNVTNQTLFKEQLKFNQLPESSKYGKYI